MTLNALREQPERLAPLVDILCAAASSDAHVAKQELDVVRARLRTMLAFEMLPQDIEDYIDSFNPEVFDLVSAVEQMALADDDDKRAVLDAALDVAVADRFVDSSEYGFVGELADLFGLPMPSRLR